MKKLLITGGAGFIGANFIRHIMSKETPPAIVNLDKLTYAGDLERISGTGPDNANNATLGAGYEFIKGDICDRHAVDMAFAQGIDTVVHFAAESHVDRSIADATPFEESNVRGTLTLLEAARHHAIDTFIHISTDEVYGDIMEGQFHETTPLNPNSPYSASKAAGDLFVRAYQRTYGLPAIIIRPSNNYGPWQYPEKLIPVVISRAMDDKPVPVYARGQNIREWLYVEDCCEAIYQVIQKGRKGEVYNLGSSEEAKNIDLVKMILSLMNKPESLIEYVKDRPGHDFRYSLNADKLRAETGWSPQMGFNEGMEATVKWYLQNEQWWRKHLT